MYSLVYIGRGQYGLTVTRNKPEYVCESLTLDELYKKGINIRILNLLDTSCANCGLQRLHSDA